MLLNILIVLQQGDRKQGKGTQIKAFQDNKSSKSRLN